MGADKHVYANPLSPATCPILSLAMYLATIEICTAAADGKTAVHLFPGKEQGSRISSKLAKLLKGVVIPAVKRLCPPPQKRKRQQRDEQLTIGTIYRQ